MVSVIVPVYNAEGFLPRSVGSVLGQTWQDFELILVDDGSTDGSGALCDARAREDARVRVLHTANGGPSAARNAGLETAAGGRVLFLDADDALEPACLERLAACAGATGADVVVGGFTKVRDSAPAGVRCEAFPESRPLARADLVECARRYLKKPNRFELFSYSWGRLFDASLIRRHRLRFDPRLHTYEDVDFNYRFLRHARAGHYLAGSCYDHLLHESYGSARMAIAQDGLRMFGYRTALESVAAFLAGELDPGAIARETGHAYVFLTIIQFVRVCGQLSRANARRIHAVVREIVRDQRTRRSLPCYAPEAGDSQVLPLLMRLGLVTPIVLVCWRKAVRRYSRGAR